MSSNVRVPGLTRDLSQSFARFEVRGPGSSPGRISLFVNRIAPTLKHVVFCLHHGLPPRRCALHRTQYRFASTGRSTSGWVVAAYSKVQNQDAGLVRRTRRFRAVPQARAQHQTLAAPLENSTDYASQPKLARCDRPYTRVTPVPGRVRDLFQLNSTPQTSRPRVMPGARYAY